jgi:hypothetical protein
MALQKGINSYVTLNEADSYFEDRLDVASWQNAEDELKEQALVSAAYILDDMEWLGQVVKPEQALAFPRTNGVFLDSSRGIRTVFTSTYEFSASDEAETSLGRDIRLVRRATYELAYHLINNDGLLDSSGTVKDIKVGSISIQEIKETSTASLMVRKIIKPMLKNSSNSWWGY